MFRRNKVAFLATLIFSVTLLVHLPVAATTPPVAAFTYTPSAPILGDVVVFDASASTPDGGTIVSYTWDFGDGTGKSVPSSSVEHNYTAVGNYNVTLTVTDSETKTDTTWQIVTVRDYPVAIFTHSPERPIVDETVTFDASLSTPEGGSITSYYWDFDDGASANVTTPITTHTYTAVGDRNVTLTVTDNETLTDTAWDIVTVRDYPVAIFTHSPERPIVDETVTFDASLSTPEGGSITSYYWDFDDGASANVTTPITTHTYTAVGDRNVTLTVTDNETLTDTAWDIVTVRDYPVATFTYSPAAPLVNEMVTFNASLSTPDNGTIISYYWDFGDGSSPVTEADPITNHTYTTFGTFTVTLTITDSEDLTDDFSDTIRILIAPVANFTYSPTWPAVNETVTFNASASYDPDGSGSIVSYRWDFGDSTNATGMIVNHNYTAFGTYNVTLTVTDDDDLTDILWKLVTVYTEVPVHDVAITNVTTSATEVWVGEIVNITVVVKNEGTAVETFNVTVYYDAISIGTQTVTNLFPDAEETLTFSWNTTGVTPLNYNYTISAQASLLPGPPPETDTADNTFTNGIVKVKMVGDLDGNGVINIKDIGIIGKAFGSRPGDPNWLPIADVYEDGKINIKDIGVVAKHFGERL